MQWLKYEELTLILISIMPYVQLKSSFIPHYIYAEIIQGSYDKYALTDIYLYILKDSTMGYNCKKNILIQNHY